MQKRNRRNCKTTKTNAEYEALPTQQGEGGRRGPYPAGRFPRLENAAQFTNAGVDANFTLFATFPSIRENIVNLEECSLYEALEQLETKTKGVATARRPNAKRETKKRRNKPP